MAERRKLSTTIGPKNYAWLENMVKAGKAESVGQAVDKAVELSRRLDRRAALGRDTVAYFNSRACRPKPPRKSQTSKAH